MNESKRVIAVVPFELWQEAHFKGVSWSDAIRIGIGVKLGNYNEGETIRQKINELKNQIKFYQNKLDDATNKKHEDKMKEKTAKKIKDEKQKFLEDNKNIFEYAHNKCKNISSPDVADVYEFWDMTNRKYHQKFKQTFPQDEFMKVLGEMK